MKKLLCIFLAVVTVLFLCACGAQEEAANADDRALQVGFASMECMPDSYPVHIAGGDVMRDICEQGFLDKLTVRCIALQQGDKTYLVFSCDVVDIDGAFCKETDAMIANATGLPQEQIILNATHTHSAPALKANVPGKAEYLAKFNQVCAKVGIQAMEDLSPATLSYGSIMTEHMVRVRHYLMLDGTTYGNGHGDIKAGIKEHHYPSDEECQVIRIHRPAEDKKDIVMMNLGAHCTIVSGGQGVLSADYPSAAREYVETQTDAHCIFFIAAAGDQIPSSKIPGEVPNGNDQVAYGKQLGEYVVKCLETMTPAEGTDLHVYTETYTAKRMKEGTDDPVQMEHAREIVRLYNQYGSYSVPEVSSKVTEYGFSSYYEASGLVTRENAPETGTFVTNTMTIGNVGFVFAPYEMFSTQGAQIKETSPMAMTFIITCSEDDQVYFPNEIACEHSYYEYDVTPYARGTGEAVADRYVEILTAIKDGNTPAPLAPVS